MDPDSAFVDRLFSMTDLLIDLGNTALKWTVSSFPDDPSTFIHQGRDQLPEELQERWLSLKPRKVVGCMVSSENLALSMIKFFNRHQIPWEWLHSERRFDGSFHLVNGYDDYEQLGSDRWHAAIGAASLVPHEPFLVIHMGTATTVDTVLPDGDCMFFKGGRILPGPSMMFDSLLKGTRCRPGHIGSESEFPTNTADAMSTGILEAHLGVIDRAVSAVIRAGFSAPRIFFAGGAAPLLAPYIKREYPQAVQQHNLVLRGLALRA